MLMIVYEESSKSETSEKQNGVRVDLQFSLLVSSLSFSLHLPFLLTLSQQTSWEEGRHSHFVLSYLISRMWGFLLLGSGKGHEKRHLHLEM